MFDAGHYSDSDNDDPEEEEDEVTIYDIPGNTYSPTKVGWVYILNYFLSMGSNLDHGALPVAIPVLKVDLNLNQAQLGWLGSLVFLGILGGSIASTVLFTRVSYKTLLFVSFVGNGIGLIVFPLASNYQLQQFSRFISGFFQIFQCIYFPNFVDTFSSKSSKTMWISFCMAAPALGVILGYGVTYAVMQVLSWRASFVIQGLYSIVLGLIFVCLPEDYTEIGLVQKRLKLVQKRRGYNVPECGGTGNLRTVANLDELTSSQQEERKEPLLNDSSGHMPDGRTGLNPQMFSSMTQIKEVIDSSQTSAGLSDALTEQPTVSTC